jgi:hypothetical protein
VVGAKRASASTSLMAVIHKKKFFNFCRKKIGVEMTTPTSGVRGMG